MYSLLYDEAVAKLPKLLIPNNHATLALLSVVLVLAAWKYWKFTKMYAGFPSCSFLLYLVYCYVFRKISKYPTNFLFQTIVSFIKKFQSEGVCIGWLVEPYLLVYGAEAVKIFSSEEAAVDKPRFYHLLGDILGTGLVTSNGDTWRKRRKMLNPVFHVGALKNKLTIFNEKAEILVKKLSEVEDKPSIDIHQYFKCCTFDVLWESVIGLKLNTPENMEMRSEFMELIEKLSEITVYRMIHPWLQHKFMLNFMPSGRKYLAMYKNLNNVSEKIILDIKESVASGKFPTADSDNPNGVIRKSFSHILIDHHMKDPSFTIEDLRSEVVTFISAGYDTISYALMWCLFVLGNHPDVQEQVYNEIETISDKHVTYGELYQLKYLECVIKETMRLYPPVPMYGRKTKKDIQCGKHLVPKETIIILCPYMLHRDPEIYPDPEKFDPERFLEGNSDKRPWIYTPFAEGFRNCIGKKFAMMEIMVVLTHVLRNFKITSLDKREDVDLCWEILLTPTKPLRMQLNLRK